MLDIRRTTVSIMAGNLEKAGAISCGRGYMQIVNREKLQRHSCECYGRVKDSVDGLHASHQPGQPRALGTKPSKAAPVKAIDLSRLSRKRPYRGSVGSNLSFK
jgi:hypothetical protein